MSSKLCSRSSIRSYPRALLFCVSARVTRALHMLQGIGFCWLNKNSALLAFRTSELASIAVLSSIRETCLCVHRLLMLEHRCPQNCKVQTSASFKRQRSRPFYVSRALAQAEADELPGKMQRNGYSFVQAVRVTRKCAGFSCEKTRSRSVGGSPGS